MRKMAMMMAVVALAGCDAGKAPTPAKAEAPVAVQAAANSAPQWEIQVNSREAVSDISAWLLERSYAPRLVTVDGKQQLLVGPFDSREAAEQKREEMLAKIAKSHRFADPVVIERKP